MFFAADVLAATTANDLLSLRAHPLLFPFATGTTGGSQRLVVPPAERESWSERLRALECELRHRRDGYGDAVVAHLTLLLVGAFRLASDVVGHLRLNDEPLLAEVFAFIEERYDEPISLGDVARAVSLSRGHLTTVVRRMTGRTVHEWIVERRMLEARRLLTETDLTVTEIGRHVGYPDPGYFARTFRRRHSVAPLQWRRAGRY